MGWYFNETQVSGLRLMVLGAIFLVLGLVVLLRVPPKK